MGNEFVNVRFSVAGESRFIKMEKGVMFKNNEGTYRVSYDGSLKFKEAGTDVWTNAKEIDIEKYQWQALQNVANNDNDAGTYTKKDIKIAQELSGKKELLADMSENLPEGYSVDNISLKSDDGTLKVHVTSGYTYSSSNLEFASEEESFGSMVMNCAKKVLQFACKVADDFAELLPKPSDPEWRDDYDRRLIGIGEY